ncbi:hypothetical protein ACA910_011892 [Epithemia clementina (nom. ined.)]
MTPVNSAATPLTRLEQEVEWNPSQVYVDLQRACQILLERGFKLAAKWAAEQWMGLPAVNVNQLPPCSIPFEYGSESAAQGQSSPLYCYAKTLMDLSEYAHAAAVLSQASNDAAVNVETMPPPLPDLSPAAVGLRAYALYMAGEQRKEEEFQERNNNNNSKGGIHNPNSDKDCDVSGVGVAISLRNPYLLQLVEELGDAYLNTTILAASDNDDDDDDDAMTAPGLRLDAFGLYVYGMVLAAAQESKLAMPTSSTPKAHKILLQSLQLFPYNWSAWLDLADCAVADRAVERELERDDSPLRLLAGNFMYHFFCAHLQTLHQDHATALAIYQTWMDPSMFGGSPYLLSQSAVVHYQLRHFAAAQQILHEMHTDMPYRLDSMDVYSNILYVQEDAVSLSQLAHVAVQVDKYRAETSCIIGNYYSLKQQRAKAIQAFQRALAMDRTYVSAWTLMGHEYVEWKQTAHAMEAYRRAVQVAPRDYRAWYGLGQTYELLSMYLYALYYYQQAAQLRPYDARMWSALGQIYIHLFRKEDAIRAYERAIQQDDTEGLATQKLASLYEEKGQDEKAAQCYFRHLELRHQITNPNAASDGPVSLEVMLQNLVVEDTEAEALLYLATHHKNHSEYETAALFCSRLLEYPGPERDMAKAMLRELRARTSRPAALATGSRRGGYNNRSGFEFSP